MNLDIISYMHTVLKKMFEAEEKYYRLEPRFLEEIGVNPKMQICVRSGCLQIVDHGQGRRGLYCNRRCADFTFPEFRPRGYGDLSPAQPADYIAGLSHPDE